MRVCLDDPGADTDSTWSKGGGVVVPLGRLLGPNQYSAPPCLPDPGGDQNGKGAPNVDPIRSLGLRVL